MSIQRHKVFISYFHADDQYYKNQLIQMKAWDNERYQYVSIFDDYSVRQYDIDDTGLSSEQIRRIIRDDYMKNATVLVLLCGQKTKTRKHVDWEIHTAMYHSDINPQMGIVVINLPTINQSQLYSCLGDRQYFGDTSGWVTLNKDASYLETNYPYLPARIRENIARDNIYIPIINWDRVSGNAYNLAGIIDVAFNNRYKNDYDHSTNLRRNNS
ncbi:MAG: TIR domain-containing protein [Firmicutes bacterium]|nr:TIR domain-containing protein [Bacillota bacterium]